MLKSSGIRPLNSDKSVAQAGSAPSLLVHVASPQPPLSVAHSSISAKTAVIVASLIKTTEIESEGEFPSEIPCQLTN